jgi:hypothetical protein
MPTAGIEWGIGKSNTCTLDSTFQAILTRCFEDPKIIAAMTNTKYDDQKIGPSLAKMIEFGKKK